MKKPAAACFFVAIRAVHRLPDRVRFRYRANGPIDPVGVVRAVQNLHGVCEARLNPGARSLSIDFEPTETSIEVLGDAVLKLDFVGTGRLQEGIAHHDGLWGVASSGALLVGQQLVPQSLLMPATLAVALPVFAKAIEDLRNEGITSHVLEAMAVAISAARRDFTAANTTSFMLALGGYLEQSIDPQVLFTHCRGVRAIPRVIEQQAREGMEATQRPGTCLHGHSCLLSAAPRRDTV